jgi:hypothetical protein
MDPELDTMRRHWAAIEAAISRTPSSVWPGFLEQRAALMAADAWVRGLNPPTNPDLAMRFGLAVTLILLGVEDVLRLWPDDDDPDGAVPRRLGVLTGTLLGEMREDLEDHSETKPLS